MKELLEKIKGNNSSLIILSDIIYSNTHHHLIPIIRYDKGVCWVFMNACIINDLKRVIKCLDKLNIIWFYRSSGLNFNDDPSSIESQLETFRDLIFFVFRGQSIPVENMEKLKILDKILEMAMYYKTNKELIQTIDSFVIKNNNQSILVSPRNRRYNRHNYIYDNDGVLEIIRRRIVINLIME